VKEAVTLIDMVAGALLGGAVLFLILLVLGVGPFLLLIGTIIGAAAGAWYGSQLVRRFRAGQRR